MAETLIIVAKESNTGKLVFAVVGIMGTLLVYGVLQEKIMRVPYGQDKEYFRFSLFLVLCNRVTTSAVSAGALLVSDDINRIKRKEKTVWGILLMIGYLGFDGFTSTFQDMLFKGYDMEIHNQIFYTTLCSTFLSFCGQRLPEESLSTLTVDARRSRLSASKATFVTHPTASRLPAYTAPSTAFLEATNTNPQRPPFAATLVIAGHHRSHPSS
ncbi:hypothetical protein HPP92_020715 [Vanilla planifolia]|uniref:Uncharacterized protein n=1 Tax=Vanilla planifolia TaxID=51239 RepID=A0A835Q381_VANPL|nr:hypothetical protein HPP92_020715 [Vanilla planifolia]